jgi:hypothetical protein
LLDHQGALLGEFEAGEESAGEGGVSAEGVVGVVPGDRWQEGGEFSASWVRRQEYCVRSMASVTRQRSGIVGV